VKQKFKERVSNVGTFLSNARVNAKKINNFLKMALHLQIKRFCKGNVLARQQFIE
jgi:hypothetical protein